MDRRRPNYTQTRIWPMRDCQRHRFVFISDRKGRRREKEDVGDMQHTDTDVGHSDA